MSLRLPAGAVHHPGADHALGINLAGQIDCYGIVDRRLAVIRGERRQLEHVLGIVKLERRVVVDYPQVVRVRARPCDRHRLAAMNRLASSVDYSRIDQPRDSGRHHLGMQPQVMLAIERTHPWHLRAWIADADLNRRTVLDELVQVSRNRLELDGWRR